MRIEVVAAYTWESFVGKCYINLPFLLNLVSYAVILNFDWLIYRQFQVAGANIHYIEHAHFAKKLFLNSNRMYSLSFKMLR